MILLHGKDFSWYQKLIKDLQKQLRFQNIFNFDDYYTQFLQQQLLNLESALHRQFNEELSSDIFPVISVKIKKISYELTLFIVFCYCSFCTRGTTTVERFLICSRILINNNHIAKKLTLHLLLQEI